MVGVHYGCGWTESATNDGTTMYQSIECSKRLAQAGVNPQSGNGRTCGYAVTEDVVLTLGLLFRTLAPMRSGDNTRDAGK